MRHGTHVVIARPMGVHGQWVHAWGCRAPRGMPPGRQAPADLQKALAPASHHQPPTTTTTALPPPPSPPKNPIPASELEDLADAAPQLLRRSGAAGSEGVSDPLAPWNIQHVACLRVRGGGRPGGPAGSVPWRWEDYADYFAPDGLMQVCGRRGRGPHVH